MRVLIQFFTFIYFLTIRIASIWNKKAKLFINGRKETKIKLANFTQKNEVLYWFHCASLGEFEQARPIIEGLKKRETCDVAVSFFSPSGYEIRKSYELADVVFYLPRDSKTNAKYVLEKLKPSKVFFVKYEFWPNYILELYKQNIPTYVVSGVFRKTQIFFKWYGGFMRKVLKSFTAIFVQNEASVKLLKTINVQSLLTGDTRYDRVMSNANNVKLFPKIEKFVKGSKTVVLGSVWAEDEAVVLPVINEIKNIKFVIAPHEINESHLKHIEQNLAVKSIRYSEFEKTEEVNADALLIDNIGMLMHLYQFADVAYIGGAFGKGLHNILEPASFGVPVIFGPKYQKFPEAFEFRKHQIGFSISSKSEAKKRLLDLLNAEDINKKVLNYMKGQTGATEKIFLNI